jgi:ribonuclease E
VPGGADAGDAAERDANKRRRRGGRGRREREEGREGGSDAPRDEAQASDFGAIAVDAPASRLQAQAYDDSPVLDAPALRAEAPPAPSGGEAEDGARSDGGRRRRRRGTADSVAESATEVGAEARADQGIDAGDERPAPTPRAPARGVTAQAYVDPADEIVAAGPAAVAAQVQPPDAPLMAPLVAAPVVVDLPPEQVAITPAAAPAPEPVPAPLPMPVPVPAAAAQPYVLALDDLAQIARGAGLEWINSDADKIASVRAAIAAEPRPLHVPRVIVPVVLKDDGPLVLVETRRDLAALKLPFDTSPTLQG